jgi:hypothetical protein
VFLSYAINCLVSRAVKATSTPRGFSTETANPLRGKVVKASCGEDPIGFSLEQTVFQRFGHHLWMKVSSSFTRKYCDTDLGLPAFITFFGDKVIQLKVPG